MALRKRSLLYLDIIWYPILAAPELSPNSVTRLGSPPNAAILSLTHCMATNWSFRPKLPVQSEARKGLSER